MTDTTELDHLRDLKALLTPKRQELKSILTHISQETDRAQTEHSTSQAKLKNWQANQYAVETDINTIEKIRGTVLTVGKGEIAFRTTRDISSKYCHHFIAYSVYFMRN